MTVISTLMRLKHEEHELEFETVQPQLLAPHLKNKTKKTKQAEYSPK